MGPAQPETARGGHEQETGPTGPPGPEGEAMLQPGQGRRLLEALSGFVLTCYEKLFAVLFPLHRPCLWEISHGGRRFLITRHAGPSGVHLDFQEQVDGRDVTSLGEPLKRPLGPVARATLYTEGDETRGVDVTRILRQLAGPGGRFTRRAPTADQVTAVLAAVGGHDPLRMLCVETRFVPGATSDGLHPTGVWYPLQLVGRPGLAGQLLAAAGLHRELHRLPPDVDAVRVGGADEVSVRPELGDVHPAPVLLEGLLAGRGLDALEVDTVLGAPAVQPHREPEDVGDLGHPPVQHPGLAAVEGAELPLEREAVPSWGRGGWGPRPGASRTSPRTTCRPGPCGPATAARPTGPAGSWGRRG
ncbi:hypothetical protein WJX74_005207 [Apatococcus lobatus]|uniref:Uncharacterized protein n=1 Tax=Apatococcus lobatus TaxID=904363 RepID=A0AAW1Q1U8_9CHLO